MWRNEGLEAYDVGKIEENGVESIRNQVRLINRICTDRKLRDW
jgi:hypothetical protein